MTGDDTQTQIVLNCEALPRLGALLLSPKKGVRKEACWTISNITAGVYPDFDSWSIRPRNAYNFFPHCLGDKDQIQAALDAQIFPPLIDLLTHGEFDIKKEAAWALSNATSGGSSQQIRTLVELGSIKPLCDLLDAKDTRILSVALEGLENILQAWMADMES